MNKFEPLSLADLPDLSDWGLSPMYTIEQAALLFAGIDPAFTENLEQAKGEHPEKYRHAYIAKQAFCSGIVTKTLQVYDLYLFDLNGTYRANQETDLYSMRDICTTETLVQRMVLLNWVERQRFLSLRQTIKQRELNASTSQVAAQETPILIEHKPLEPLYSTPEFETACSVVKEFWNKLPAGVKPPKEFEIQAFIEKILAEKIGGKPSNAAIQRVDTLTRPPMFKNQKTKSK